MVDFSFVVSLYVSDLLNVTTSIKTLTARFATVRYAAKCGSVGHERSQKTSRQCSLTLYNFSFTVSEGPTITNSQQLSLDASFLLEIQDLFFVTTTSESGHGFTCQASQYNIHKYANSAILRSQLERKKKQKKQS